MGLKIENAFNINRSNAWMARSPTKPTVIFFQGERKEWVVKTPGASKMQSPTSARKTIAETGQWVGECLALTGGDSPAHIHLTKTLFFCYANDFKGLMSRFP
jgi:hypothetical protein